MSTPTSDTSYPKIRLFCTRGQTWLPNDPPYYVFPQCEECKFCLKVSCPGFVPGAELADGGVSDWISDAVHERLEACCDSSPTTKTEMKE